MLSTDQPRLSLGGWISWIVIWGFTFFILGNTTLQQFGKQEVATEASAKDLMQVNLQAKMIVGQKELFKSIADAGAVAEKEPTEVDGESGDDPDAAKAIPEMPKPDISALDVGSYEQRLCNAGIINELDGPDESLEYLDELDKKVAENDFERSEEQEQMESSVRQLMENYRDGNLDSRALPEQQRKQLEDRLGFSGQLLLNPPESKTAGRAKLETLSFNAAIAAVAGIVLAVLFFLGGIVALLFILTYVMTGSSPGIFAARVESHNVYVETFALWLLAFFGLQMGVRELGLLKTETQALIANPIFFFGSLIVLAWPIVRGIPASQMFKDIGWTPKHFFRNTFLAIPAYAAWLPAVLVGAFVVFTLMLLAPTPEAMGEFSVPAMPGHPIQGILASGDRLAWITVIIAACVAAPLVEETMFRGVLYRHLRGWTAKYGMAISITIAAVLNSFIFASLHPQGILAVPLLMTLAIGFTLVREWRDSLWTSILMHAFNNSMMILVTYFIL